MKAARAQIEAEAAERARRHAEDKERRRQRGPVPATIPTPCRPPEATGRLTHDEQVSAAPRGRIPQDATARERMARKLRTKPGRAAYSRRKTIGEPVFGQIMTCQDGRELLPRGENGARGEWRLLAACHNLRKIFRHAGNAGLAAARAYGPAGAP